MVPLSRLTQWLGGAALRAGRAPVGEDWRLWHEAGTGRADSATRLVKLLTPQAYGLAIQMLGRAEDAEDAVQDAFARLWRSAPSDSHGASLATYFNTIVINRCRSLLTGRRELATEQEALTELQDASQAQQSGGAADSYGPADAALDQPAMAARLATALARLPSRQRMAVVMWAYADASVGDIARTLEIDPNATHQLLHRAKLALRSHLEGAAP